MKFGYLALFCLLVPLVQSQIPSACVQRLINNAEFHACIRESVPFLTKFIENVLREYAAAHDDFGMNIMKLTCTEGGLAFMKCMKEYVVGCQELIQMTAVVNVSSADLQWAFDNLDNLCSEHFGPCTTVQQCIELGSNDVFDPEGGMILGATAGNINLMMGMNPYIAFLMQASMICGLMKRQFDCMVNHLDKCPDEVEKTEKILRSSIEESVQSNPAFGSYDDMKIFMNEDCKKMPAKLSEDRCLRTAFSSRGFMICFYNAITSYTEEKGEKCKLYKLQSHCMDVYVSGCGKEKTDFMKTNMHRIINVPASCKPEHEEL